VIFLLNTEKNLDLIANNTTNKLKIFLPEFYMSGNRFDRILYSETWCFLKTSS